MEVGRDNPIKRVKVDLIGKRPIKLHLHSGMLPWPVPQIHVEEEVPKRALNVWALHQFSISLTNNFSKIYVKFTLQFLKCIYMDNLYWVINDLWCNNFHQQLPKINPIRFAWRIRPDYCIFFTSNHEKAVSIPHYLKNLMFLLFG